MLFRSLSPSYKYKTTYEKEQKGLNLEEVIKLRILRWEDYLGLSRRVQPNHKVLIRGRQSARVIERDTVTASDVGVTWGHKGMQADSTSWKSQRNGFSSRASNGKLERNCWPTLDI